MPPGSPLLAVRVPRWGGGPDYRLVFKVASGPTPAATLDGIDRFVRLAAPYLAAAAGERRHEETRKRLDATARELSVTRRGARGAVADALVGRIAGRIFTELADPLGAVLGCTRSLSEVSDEATRGSLLEDLLDASSRGCRIVERLAALGGLGSRGEWGAFHPKAAVLEAVEEGVRALRAAGGRIGLDVADELPEIEGNRDLFRLALSTEIAALVSPARPGSEASLAFEAKRASGGLGLRAKFSTSGASLPSSTDGDALGCWIAGEIWKELRAKVERAAEPGIRWLAASFPIAGSP